MIDDARGAAARLWAAAGRVGRVPVRGGSMAPLLRDGDRVRIRAAANPRAGDVVAALSSQGLLVHRLVARQGDRVVLRGDAVPRCDPPLDAAAVLGIVTAIECRGRPWRRLEGPWARSMGRAAAALARAARAAARRGGRGAGQAGAPHANRAGEAAWPRPSGIARAQLAIEQLLLPPMAPEQAFLLLACRQRISEEAAARARALVADGLDWEGVLQLARRGQVGPLLHAGFDQLGLAGQVPAATWDRTRALYTGSWARSFRQRELLERMAEACAAEGIELLAHKGAALALTVYDDPALRIAGDIDLCVRDAERARAERLTAELRRALVAAHPDRRDPDGYHVELDGTAHHDVDASRHGGGGWRALSLDWEGVWDRSERVGVGKHAVRVPCATDLVLTIVANAVRRGFTPLRLIGDLAEAIAARGGEIRWEDLAAELARSRLDRRAWIPLGLAAEWFDADVPPDLLEPPPDLRLLVHERAILAVKQRRPLLRVPSRVLWAGGYAAAAAASARLVTVEMRRRSPRLRR